jgi:hypothetical protein
LFFQRLTFFFVFVLWFWGLGVIVVLVFVSGAVLCERLFALLVSDPAVGLLSNGELGVRLGVHPVSVSRCLRLLAAEGRVCVFGQGGRVVFVGGCCGE